jgi:hypothetical protein
MNRMAPETKNYLAQNINTIEVLFILFKDKTGKEGGREKKTHTHTHTHTQREKERERKEADRDREKLRMAAVKKNTLLHVLKALKKIIKKLIHLNQINVTTSMNPINFLKQTN